MHSKENNPVLSRYTLPIVDAQRMSDLLKILSGLLTIGHEVSSLHLIPPGLEHFTSVGHCPDLCTQVRYVSLLL